MSWKCTPQLMGLVRGEPKPGQKHRANGLKISMEAGKERASRSKTLDREKSKDNRYLYQESVNEYMATQTAERAEAAVRMLQEAQEAVQEAQEDRDRAKAILNSTKAVAATTEAVEGQQRAARRLPTLPGQ